MHDHDVRPLRDLDDWRHVLDRIEFERVEAWIDRVAVGDQGERVAVGRRLETDLDADRAAGTRPVLDDELLPHRSADARRDEARNEVVAAAGREGDDNLYRTVRIVLGQGA